MEFLHDLLVAIWTRPGAVAVCIGFPVLLMFIFGGDGPGVGGGDCDGDGD